MNVCLMQNITINIISLEKWVKKRVEEQNGLTIKLITLNYYIILWIYNYRLWYYFETINIHFKLYIYIDS